MIELSPLNGWIAFDSKGIRYPWYTSGALEVLDKMDLENKAIFEYGVGHSTGWYDTRCEILCGVDSSDEWAFAYNAKLRKDKEGYLKEIYNHKFKFDIVAIDGDYRDECTQHAIACINPGGIIITDNWMQPSVPPNEWFRTLDLMAVKGLPHTVYRQENHPDWSTMIIQC